jgi:hypothetical protein
MEDPSVVDSMMVDCTQDFEMSEDNYTHNEMSNFDLNQRNVSMHQHYERMQMEESPVIRKAASHGVNSSFLPNEFSISEPRVQDQFENLIENNVGNQLVEKEASDE